MSGPYYADDSVTLWHGDFREILPTLGDVAFDAIVTDPPYGETSLDWDVWPKGWPSFVAPFARSMWCFGSMRMFLDQRDEFAGWKLSQDIVWQKNAGSGFHADRFRRIHEFATHWYQGDWAGVHHAAPRVPNEGPDQGAVRGGANRVPHYGGMRANTWTDDGTRMVTSVIRVKNMRTRATNETEKPTGILEPLIEYAVPPGGVLLDIFGGSASSARAARALGRRAVLIEKRESQCEKAAERLSQGVLDLTGGAA